LIFSNEGGIYKNLRKGADTMAIDVHRRELNKIVKQVPKEKQPIAKSLANELAFMLRTLDDLRSEIDENGAVELFKNGKQEMRRESPAMKVYNTTIQRYSLLYKQLMDLIPKEENEGKGKVNSIYDFIQND